MKVKTTYLEIGEEDEFKPKEGYREKVKMIEVQNDIYLNYFLFTGVGLPWRWYSRLKWTMKEWDEYLSSGRVKTYLGFSNLKLIGYYELFFVDNNDVEIKFIGLFPGNMGGGLGGMLLSHAIDSARANNVNRIWLHTCSNDSETALQNYLARGFRIFREEENFEHVPDKSELIELISVFYNRYIDRLKGGIEQ